MCHHILAEWLWGLYLTSLNTNAAPGKHGILSVVPWLKAERVHCWCIQDFDTGVDKAVETGDQNRISLTTAGAGIPESSRSAA